MIKPGNRRQRPLRVSRRRQRIEKGITICRTVSAEASSSESREEEFLRVRTPSMDGFRSYQSRSAAVVAAAHLKGIAIGKIRRNLAVIADRDIGALFAKLNVIAVVFE
jgi:hypothetical protein